MSYDTKDTNCMFEPERLAIGFCKSRNYKDNSKDWRQASDAFTSGYHHGKLSTQPAPAAVPGSPSFESAEALALWLENLHATTPDGAICANKWEPAQIAARAVRGQSCPPAPAEVDEGWNVRRDQPGAVYLVRDRDRRAVGFYPKLSSNDALVVDFINSLGDHAQSDTASGCPKTTGDCGIYPALWCYRCPKHRRNGRAS